MTRDFRIMLLLAALLLLWFVMHNIRRSKLVIAESLFWFLFSAILVVLAVFPEITFWAARLLGIESPVNLVYLVIIAVLVWRQFRTMLSVSALNSKLEEVAQQAALDRHDEEQEHHPRG
jgi:hypothetical protein